MPFVNGLWPAYRRPTRKGTVLTSRKGTILKLASVQFANGLRPSNTWPVRQVSVPTVLYSPLVSGIDYSGRTQL